MVRVVTVSVAVVDDMVVAVMAVAVDVVDTALVVAAVGMVAFVLVTRVVAVSLAVAVDTVVAVMVVVVDVVDTVMVVAVGVVKCASVMDNAVDTVALVVPLEMVPPFIEPTKPPMR